MSPRCARARVIASTFCANPTPRSCAAGICEAFIETRTFARRLPSQLRRWQKTVQELNFPDAGLRHHELRVAAVAIDAYFHAHVIGGDHITLDLLAALSDQPHTPALLIPEARVVDDIVVAVFGRYGQAFDRRLPDQSQGRARGRRRRAWQKIRGGSRRNRFWRRRQPG